MKSGKICFYHLLFSVTYVGVIKWLKNKIIANFWRMLLLTTTIRFNKIQRDPIQNLILYILAYKSTILNFMEIIETQKIFVSKNF